MRCPNCEKFVSLEVQDPEVENINFEDGVVEAQVRLVRACAECSEELKEATFEFTHSIEELEGYSDGDEGVEFDYDDPEVIEEGGGRYDKSYFGVSLKFTINWTDERGKLQTYSHTFEDKIAASHMEELM